jgi:hypothetical protein
VLENGSDVCNSESDSENSDRGEELEGMYTEEMLDSERKPKMKPVKLSPQEAACQRAAAKMIAPQGPKDFLSRSNSPSLTGQYKSHARPLRPLAF